MGMDMYIEKIWRNPQTKEVEDREELCYWRKFWALHNYLGLYEEGEYDIDVPLMKEDVERCLHYVSHNRDYFGSFESVASVCDLLNKYDWYKDNGYEIVYNANW